MKKLISILIGTFFAGTGFGQQNFSDHLLWYTGKLIKPNVLLTTTGDTIFYNPQKREVKRISKSGAGKKFDIMFAELNRTSKRIEQTVNQMTKELPGPLLGDMNAAVTRAYNDLADEWKPLLSNTFTLPEAEVAFTSKKINGKGCPGIFLEEDDPFEEILKKVRAFTENHKDDDLGILPVPPVYNYAYCFPCDSIANDRYDKEKDRFHAAIMGLYTDLQIEVLTMCQQIQRTYGDALYKEENEAIKKQHDEAFAFYEFFLQTAAKKAVLLVDKYKNDPYRIPAVLEFVLSTDRLLQLQGSSDESAFGNMDYWFPMMNTLYQFFSNKLKEKDYTVGLNVNAILRFERTNQLLGILKDKGHQLFDDLMKFNQFKINSNITAKLGNDDGHIMGHVRGDNWFYAIPDAATCRLNWTMANSPIDRLARYKLLAAEMVGAPVEYVGTKDWQSQPPVIKMDFCYKEGEEVVDSILANTFHPEGFRERWKFPEPVGVIEVEQVSGILMTSFLNVEQVKKEAEAINKEKMEKMQKDMQAKYMKMASNNATDMSKMTLKMQADMEKLNREIREMLVKSNPLRYVFTPQVNNKTANIFKERLNGKELFPENGGIEYAWFHLHMDHDPDGPYPLNVHLFHWLLQ